MLERRQTADEGPAGRRKSFRTTSSAATRRRCSSCAPARCSSSRSTAAFCSRSCRSQASRASASAFKDSAEAFRAMDGDLGNHVRDAIRTAGLYVHPKMWENGMRQITSGVTTRSATRCRLGRLQDPHPARRAVGGLVQVARRRARSAELQRSLHRAAIAGVRRPGEPVRHHRHRAAVRSAEVPQRDEPHVVGVSFPGQSGGLEGAAARRAVRRRRDLTKYALLQRRDTQQRNDSLSENCRGAG